MPLEVHLILLASLIGANAFLLRNRPVRPSPSLEYALVYPRTLAPRALWRRIQGHFGARTPPLEALERAAHLVQPDAQGWSQSAAQESLERLTGMRQMPVHDDLLVLHALAVVEAWRVEGAALTYRFTRLERLFHPDQAVLSLEVGLYLHLSAAPGLTVGRTLILQADDPEALALALRSRLAPR